MKRVVVLKMILLIAPAEGQVFAGKELGFGIVVAVQRDHVAAGIVVAAIQALLAHGQELAFIGGAAAFCKPFDLRMPEQVLLTPAHALNVGLQRFIILQGNLPAKLPVVLYLIKAVLFTELGIGGIVQ